jgi:hypothetical protein
MTQATTLTAFHNLFLNMDSLDWASSDRCLDTFRHLVGYLPHTRVTADLVCLNNPACVVRVILFKYIRAIDVAYPAIDAFLSINSHSHLVSPLYCTTLADYWSLEIVLTQVIHQHRAGGIDGVPLSAS